MWNQMHLWHTLGVLILVQDGTAAVRMEEKYKSKVLPGHWWIVSLITEHFSKWRKQVSQFLSHSSELQHNIFEFDSSTQDFNCYWRKCLQLLSKGVMQETSLRK
jgi:hypothetical protein